MNCGSCKHEVLKQHELIFYEKKEKEVHLIIKPEIVVLVEGKKQVLIEPEKKKIRIKCPYCQGNIGVKLPFAPNNTSFSGFAVDKVTLNGKNHSAQGWPNVYKELGIEIRDSNNFFSYCEEEPIETTIYCRKVDTPVKFPSNDIKDYEWHSVSLRKQPFDYQVQAFVEALQSNLIVVLNTGAGKTLIASMLLSRMRKLNPNRIGLMIVERIPLVFQQATAIAADTGLHVESMCGEKKTQLSLREINNGTYDVLVITAGSFIELVRSKKIDVSLFCCVVFDECHHLTGQHVYLDVMNAFTSLKKEMQPRLIGLSASPFNATSINEGENKMIKLQYNFPDVKFFTPETPPAHQQTIEEKIELESEQKRYVNFVVARINSIIKNLKESFDNEIQYLANNDRLSNFRLLLGQIRFYKDSELHKDYVNELDVLLILLETLEDALYMGIPFALKKLEREPQFSDIVSEFQTVTSLSSRMKCLRRYINDSSKESKILIFVNTRGLARSLSRWAKEEYSHLNPQMVVGHGGYDGMQWYGEQDEAIRKFSSDDDSNLLISTTVLEEGIDVAACDLVIGFTGSTSLIQFIQMRGRARKKDSKFVLFEAEDEKVQRTKAKELEKLMKTILKNNRNKTSSHLTDHSKSIISAIKEKVPFDFGRSYADQDFNVKTDGRDLCFTLFVENSATCQDIKSVITKRLSLLDCFKLKKLSEFDNSREATLIAKDFLCTSSARVFLAYAVVSQSSVTPSEIYRLFCTYFDFRVAYKGQFYNVYANENMLPVSESKEVKSIDCSSIACGYFQKNTELVISKEFATCHTVKFTPKTDIQIIKEIENENSKIIASVKLNTVRNFAFLTYGNQEVQLILTLDSPPLFYNAQKVKGDQLLYTRLYNNDNQRCFSDCPILILKFHLKDEVRLREILNTKVLFPFQVFDTKFEFMESQSQSPTEDMSPLLNEKLLWDLKCLEDSRNLCLQKDIVSELSKYVAENPSEYINDILKASLTSLIAGTSPYFTDVMSYLKARYQDMQQLIDSEFQQLLKPKVPQNHVLIKRMVITPTRIIACVEHPTALSRLLRYASEHNIKLAIVSFLDEDGTKIQDQTLIPRYKTILSEGFVINNERYLYLLSSGSQLREHKGYFVKSEDQSFVQSIRNMFVPNPYDFKSVAKYLSRLGMYATADFVACQIDDDEINWGTDIVAENNDLTTDGSGLISLTKANELKDTFDLQNTPSAFQIRFSGCKGVLTCVEDNHPELLGKSILLRPSMQKFDNNDRTLCFVGYSKNLTLVLNREIINLLSSVKQFDLERKLMRYLNERLSYNMKMFEYEGLAKLELSRHLTNAHLVELWNGGLKFLQDSYWFDLLRGIYRLQTKVLKSRMNMRVEMGSLLIGVPDPYGVLKEDEIFVQINKDSSDDFVVIESRALIYRNPCLHPGDCRVVKCVLHDRLLHLKNVVVLPSRNCKRSLAAQCSGGDLDGDKFAVIWDEELVPTESYEPCDYGNLSSNQASEIDDVTNAKEIADFFSNFMTNDSLGRIANLHLALCDIKEDGARDPLAIKLSEAQSSAVDYPKTGVKPIIPEEALKEVKENNYPDFMEKKVEFSYPSKKPLGKLYRHCQSIAYDYYVKDVFDDDIFPDNVFLELKGFEIYLQEAKNLYKVYCYQMEMIMSKFNLVDETDIVLSDATYGWDEQLEENRAKISESIKQTYNAIKDAFRQIFFQSTSSDEQLKKAYAWYYLVYNKESVLDVEKPMKSFPWILSDVLCKNKQLKKVSSSNVNIQIGRSTRLLFKKKIDPIAASVSERFQLVEVVNEKIKKFMKTEFKVEKNSFLVFPYGSTSIFLNEPESDIDICVIALPPVYKTKVIPTGIQDEFRKMPKQNQSRHFIQMVLSRAVEPIATDKSELIHDNQKVPLVKFMTHSKDNPIKCDISMNENGLLKTYYMHFLYKENPIYYIVLFNLVQWARAADVIKSDLSGGIRTIDTADFYALVIHVLEFPEAPAHDVRKKMEFVPLNSLKRGLKKLSVNQYHEIGKMMLTFFQKLSHMKTEVHMKWPVPTVTDVDIPSDMMELISTYATRAVHCLLYERRMDRLIEYLIKADTPSDFTMNLGTSLSYTIGKAKAFFEGKLSVLSGVDVHLSLDDKKQLILCTNASRKAKIIIKNEILKYKNTSKTICEGQLPQCTSRYFMEGASTVLPPQDTVGDSRVKFVPSDGAYESLHGACERSVICIDTLNKEAMGEWEQMRRRKFAKHVLRQLKSFPCNNKEMRESLEITTRFGCLYFLNTSTALPPTSIFFDELDHAMERGKKNRSQWYRNEYEDFNMVPMKAKAPVIEKIKDDDLQEIIKNEMKRKKKRASGISSSFAPSLLRNNTDDRNTIMLLEEIFGKVVERMGFVEGRSVIQRPRCSYKVSVVVSTSYELQLSLSEDFSLIMVEERPLNWVHATLINCEEQKFSNDIQSNVDARIIIGTVEKVSKSFDLYKKVLIKDGELVLPVKLENGAPIANKDSNFWKKVLNIRQVDKTMLYTDGRMDIGIVIGRNYSLKELKAKREMCEMSLYVDTRKMQEALTDNLNVDKLTDISNEVFDVSRKVQKILQEEIEQHDDILMQ